MSFFHEQNMAAEKRKADQPGIRKVSVTQYSKGFKRDQFYLFTIKTSL